MNCHRCKKTMGQVTGMVPIDPKGTENRRWVCTECAVVAEIESVPDDVNELCTLINPKFMPPNEAPQ